jgi:hypothetical protein
MDHAFPHHFTQDSIGDCTGMTLRDYFAAKVLVTAIKILDLPQYDDPFIWSGDEIESDMILAAKYAYTMADAMLKVRDEH